MKTILITGASGGIGSEIARTLAKRENKLILIYNSNENEIDKLKKELSTKCEVFVHKCDLKISNNIKNLIEKIIKEHKKIDVLINCAGVSLFKQIQDTTEEDYQNIFDSNLKSTIFTISNVSKYMISEKSGCIINISSIWGVVGASMESLYSASKGAINSLTKALAKELGPSNITVNAICPGLIKTKMNDLLDQSSIDQIINETPLGRIGTPKDVAHLTEFLCGDNANFITGQVITIDGGLTI